MPFITVALPADLEFLLPIYMIHLFLVLMAILFRRYNVKTNAYQSIVLKMLANNVSTHKQKLISLTTGIEGHIYPTALL